MNDITSFLCSTKWDILTDVLFGLIVLALLVLLVPTLALYIFIVVSCAAGVVVTALAAFFIGCTIKEKFNV